MNKILKIVLFPLSIIGMFLIIVYKYLISPLLPHTCRYIPTCSSYAISALREYGFFKGIFLTFKRICRCTPFYKGGFDPVPDNIKGDIKWLI